ncbi:hypothetical protein B0H12DRAFT_531505 [Mycena haematopus]|nr:hypothetical protein B0H12DRAFT_531505 [Mycena haematopus]
MPKGLANPKGRGPYSTQACTICRSKKVKCDGVKPVCGSCAASGRDDEVRWMKTLSGKTETIFSAHGDGTWPQNLQKRLTLKRSRSGLIRCRLMSIFWKIGWQNAFAKICLPTSNFDQIYRRNTVEKKERPIQTTISRKN